MDDKVCEQPRPRSDLEKQIDEKLGAVDGQVDDLCSKRVRCRRIVLGGRVGKENPRQTEQVPANVQRIVGAALK